MKFHFLYMVVVCCICSTAHAQDLVAAAQASLPFSFLLKGARPDTNGFTTKTVVEIKSSEGKGLSFPLTLRQLDSKLSASFLFTNVIVLSNEAQKNIALLALNEVSTVLDISSGSFLVLFPGIKGFVEMPAPSKVQSAIRKLHTAALQRVPLGNEVYDGVDCQKIQLVETGPEISAGVTTTAWEPVGNNNFPRKIELVGDITMTIRMLSVDFAAQASGTFEVPDGFTRYTNSTEVVNAAVRLVRERTNLKPPASQPK